MFGPGVSTMPSATSAKAKSVEISGIAGPRAAVKSGGGLLRSTQGPPQMQDHPTIAPADKSTEADPPNSADDAQVRQLVGDFLEFFGEVRAGRVPVELRGLAWVGRILAETRIRRATLERLDRLVLGRVGGAEVERD